MAEQPENSGWHLDKRVPIALIFALILQTGGAVWWISGIVHRLDASIETDVKQDAKDVALEAKDAALEAAMNSQAVGAATTAAQLVAVRESLAEMKSAQAETNRLLRDLARGTAP